MIVGYGISIIIFSIWQVVIGPYYNDVSPYISKCEEGKVCDLTNIGALMIGSLVTSFIAALIFKIQKEHSEGLMKVTRNVTEKVYARKIDYYSIDVQFDELEKEDPNKSEEKVMTDSQNLLDLLIQKGKSDKDITISGRGDAKEIVFDKGILKITKPKIKRSFYPEGYAKSVNIHLRTDNYDLLNEVIKNHKLRYWDLQWQLSDSYPVKSMMDKMHEEQGKTPSSASTSYTQGEENRSYSATYGILKLNGLDIVGKINQNNLGLTCQGRGIKQGFYRAHTILPEKIISILFGEVDFKEIKELFTTVTEP